MMLWLIGSALAAQVDEYPVVAEVALPAHGPARIHVPPDLRSALDPADASDLLLVDANGDPVPVARLDEGERWEAPVDPFEAIPTATPLLWTVNVGAAPVDGVQVRLPVAQGAAATVTIEDRRGRALSQPTLVWRLSGAQQEIVRLDEPTRGVVRVRMVPHAEGLLRAPEVTGVRLTDAGVPADELRWAVGPMRDQDNGWIRYDLELDRPLPLRSVALHPDRRVVQRRAGLQAAPVEDPAGSLLWGLAPQQPVNVERLVFQGVHAEHLDVPLSGPSSDRLALLVEAVNEPMELTEVTLELPGVHLLVLEPGPGPHRLYAGARPGTSPSWDLDIAIPELARAAGAVIEPEPAVANDEWIPPEIRGDLGAPGRELDLDGFTWSRSVQGSGLSRIALPLEVLSESRADLRDVRLELEGRQIPYIKRRRSGEVALDVPRWKTHRRDGQTLLEIPLLDPGVPVSSVTIHTDAPVFQRRVSVSRRRGADLEFLRVATWSGDRSPGALTLELGQRIGDTLVLAIDDGDNPPLPITEVEVRAPSWELVALIPDQGEVRLLTGDHSRTGPRYDLALVTDELRHRPLDEAELGERSELVPAPLTWLDRLFVAGGLGVLAIGLLGLLIDVLRRVPPVEVEAPLPAAD